MNFLGFPRFFHVLCTRSSLEIQFIFVVFIFRSHTKSSQKFSIKAKRFWLDIKTKLISFFSSRSKSSESTFFSFFLSCHTCPKIFPNFQFSMRPFFPNISIYNSSLFQYISSFSVHSFLIFKTVYIILFYKFTLWKCRLVFSSHSKSSKSTFSCHTYPKLYRIS